MPVNQSNLGKPSEKPSTAGQSEARVPTLPLWPASAVVWVFNERPVCSSFGPQLGAIGVETSWDVGWWEAFSFHALKEACEVPAPPLPSVFCLLGEQFCL